MIAKWIASALIALASLFGGSVPVTHLAGSFTPVGGTTYYLSGAGVTSSSNTIQLTSFETPDGRPLVMSMFGTTGYGALEPGSSKLEDITFSGITQNTNGTAILTGVTRGNDFVSPYAASTTLAKSHAGGSALILTNTAGFYGQQFLLANNLSTSTGGIIFSSTTPPYYDYNPNFNNFASTTLASIGFVASTSYAGTVNAGTGVKGIVQLAVPADAASSTALGSSGAYEVLPSEYATDTPTKACNNSVFAAGAGCTPIADLTGHLSQLWIDLTKQFTFSGGILSTASSTFTATTSIAASNLTNKALFLNAQPTQWPSANTFGLLENNGSGVLSYTQSVPRYSYATTTAITASSGFATSTSFGIPAGTLTASSTITYEGVVNSCAGSTNCTLTIRALVGGVWTTIAGGTIGSPGAGPTYDMSFSGVIINNGATNAQVAVGQSQALAEGDAGTNPPGQILSQKVSSSIDTTQAITLVGVVGSTNSTATLQELEITVNP